VIENESKVDKLVAAILSDQTIKIYELNTLHLRMHLKEFSFPLVSVVFSPLISSQILVATTDGSVGIWDTKSRKRVAIIKSPVDVFSLAVGCGGNVVALGGGDGSISFFNTTSTKLLGTYVESHIERVSALAFHAKYPTIIATASEDGLVNVFDISVGKEEDSLKATVHCECALASVGWCGNDALQFYAVTVYNGLDVWDAQHATRLLHLPNVPSLCTGQMNDFIVDCVFSNNLLYCFVGDNAGTLHLVHIDTTGKMQIMATVRGGHVAGVRCLLWTSTCLCTGGEDARLCLWKSDYLAKSDDHDDDENQESYELEVRTGGKIKHSRR
jgi:WD40 repeat protein